jgi:transposase
MHVTVAIGTRRSAITCRVPTASTLSGRRRASCRGPVGSVLRQRALCGAILADRPHPEQGFRSCLGILRLAKKYGDARVESACARCFAAHARSYRSVESVLRLRLDSQPVLEADADTTPAVDHENVRGPDYFVN